MTASSVSFRISRHTQDLAETVHALSQRLVTLEQRLLGLEDQLQALREQPRQAEQDETASLAPIEAHIDRLLQDCRQLLADQPRERSAAASPLDPQPESGSHGAEGAAAALPLAGENGEFESFQAA